MSHAERAVPPIQRWLALAFWLAVVTAVAWIGSWITLPKIATWYAGLLKPWFTPPNAAFGPVWAALYVMMAIAVWRIREAVAAERRRSATILFVVQLAANALWSPAFFGFESPVAGLVIIVVLLVTLLATLRSFWLLDRAAGLLLIPYVAWVSYATALNAAIVVLN